MLVLFSLVYCCFDFVMLLFTTNPILCRGHCPSDFSLTRKTGNLTKVVVWTGDEEKIPSENVMTKT